MLPFRRNDSVSREQVLSGSWLICFLILILGRSFHLLFEREKGERGLGQT